MSAKRKNSIQIKNLTITQYSIICDIVERVKDIMKWDEYMECYVDDGTFLYSMSEEDYKELQDLNI